MSLKKKTAAVAATAGMIVMLGAGFANAGENHDWYPPHHEEKTNSCGNGNSNQYGLLNFLNLNMPIGNVVYCVNY
ncbi:hypothetical protein ACFXPT_38960 [Streptomyces goshikiensis]|uniref:hypothetical protein n=1 Tax=Streptomyces goshikiensis TaxID=1942 RepID=UPI003675406B